MKKYLAIICIAIALVACVPQYQLVRASSTTVAGKTMRVKPVSAWNRIPANSRDIGTQEIWTQNGPILDTLDFVGGVPDGGLIIDQHSNETHKIPRFHSNMIPQDLASLLESYYRIKLGATIFETTSLKPTTFLGADAIQPDFNYLFGDEVKRRGRAVMAIVNGKLYFAVLSGAALHYFDAELPEFEKIVATAQVV
jgi:hypothetical protein